MKPSLIFQIGLRYLMPILLLVSVVIYWRGHQLPGGGFIGGLVAGASLAAWAYAFGPASMRKLVRVEPLSFIFVGLFCALFSGILSVFGGMEPFEGWWVAVPVLDHLGTPQLFDLGVFLIVTGLVAVFATQVLEVDP